MTNTIYFAAGAPGSGKTENLLNRAHAMASEGSNLIIAAPKKELCNELGNRLSSKKIAHTIITEDQLTDYTVSSAIEAKLSTAINEIIIITHSALFLLDNKTISNTIIVIDETPNLLEFQKISMPTKEWDRLFRYIEENDKTLKILPSKEEEIKEKNKRYKSDQRRTKGNPKSALSHNEHLIFDALLKNKTVVVRKGENKTQAQVINDHNLRKLKEITSSAKEVHLLAANIAGGIFETLAIAMGIAIEKSPLEAKTHTYDKKIIIHTLFKSPPSKSKLLSDNRGKKLATHIGAPFYQYIDIAFERAITNAPVMYPYANLVFAHDWTRFNKEDSTIKVLSPECRGLNAYSEHNVAICLFHGNASPMDAACLDIIADNIKIPRQKLREAWKISYKLERALQCSTRTSVRTKNTACRLNRKLRCKEKCQCTNCVHLYVQDMETANYLKETCMHHALIDKSLEIDLSESPRETKKSTKQLNALHIVLENKNKSKKTILEELTNSGMSTATAYRYYKKLEPHLSNQNSQNP